MQEPVNLGNTVTRTLSSESGTYSTRKKRQARSRSGTYHTKKVNIRSKLGTQEKSNRRKKRTTSRPGTRLADFEPSRVATRGTRLADFEPAGSDEGLAVLRELEPGWALRSGALIIEPLP
jgi:hypothetical protein